MVHVEGTVTVSSECLKAEGVERFRGSYGRAVIKELETIGVKVVWKEDSPPVLVVTAEDRSPGLAEIKLQTARAIIVGNLTGKANHDQLLIDLFRDLVKVMCRDFTAQIDKLTKVIQGKE